LQLEVQDHNERCEIKDQIQMLEHIGTEAEGRIKSIKDQLNVAKLDLKTKKEKVEAFAKKEVILQNQQQLCLRMH
jgi:hypothetical protein